MMVHVSSKSGGVTLPARVDAGLAAGCVRVAAAVNSSAGLGPMFGTVTIEKAALAAAAE